MKSLFRFRFFGNSLVRRKLAFAWSIATPVVSDDNNDDNMMLIKTSLSAKVGLPSKGFSRFTEITRKERNSMLHIVPSLTINKQQDSPSYIVAKQ